MNIRQDIQALRGFAVLVVVIFHARLNLLPAGYLGVDIFFVISGFLITSMVKSQIERDKFSFTEFYFRRAKRLLPAAYTTFAITALLSAFLLTSPEFRQFADQLAGAVTFTANFVLMRQGSYFGGDADLKPLLHTWSLSIEEQYYLVLPALLYFIPRRFWLQFVIIVVILSLAACVGMALWRPDIAFYFFPTRAWELGLGSLGAFIIGRNVTSRASAALFWPAVAALIILPIVPFGGLHPGIDAFLACFATLIIILRNHPLANGAVTRPLAVIGDFSYSLYLVHWPLFALATNVWVGELPLWAKWSGVGLSFILAYAQYRLVEDPVRRAPISFTWRRAGLMASLSAAVIAIPYAAIALGAAPQSYATERRGNTGLGTSCVSNDHFTPRAECMSTSTPTELVWGDSYAMHLIPGINATRGAESIVQATKYVCGPLIGIAPVGHLTGATQNANWARGCLSYNNDVIAYLRATPSIHTVILSSVFKQYMTAGDFGILVATANGHREVVGGIDPVLRAMTQTVKVIRAMGKRVVVIAPPPALDWDAGRCAERKLRAMSILGEYPNCDIPDGEYQAKRKLVLTFLAQLPRDAGVNVIMFDDTLRRGNGYAANDGRTILYIANGHLSYAGSVLLARKMDMGGLINRLAK